MYWGNEHAADASSGASVFTDANNFKGAYHMNDPQNTAPDGYKDASDNGNHGTAYGSGPDDIEGVIGVAKYFDGTEDWVEISGLMGSPSSVTLSGWAGLEAGDDNGAEIASIGNYVGMRLDDIPQGSMVGFYLKNGGWNTTIKPSPDHAGTGCMAVRGYAATMMKNISPLFFKNSNNIFNFSIDYR